LCFDVTHPSLMNAVDGRKTKRRIQVHFLSKNKPRATVSIGLSVIVTRRPIFYSLSNVFRFSLLSPTVTEQSTELRHLPAQNYLSPIREDTLTFRHRASCILGQAFRYSPEKAFYIFNQQIYFII